MFYLCVLTLCIIFGIHCVVSFIKGRNMYLDVFPSPPGDWITGQGLMLSQLTEETLFTAITQISKIAPIVLLRQFHIPSLLVNDKAFVEFLSTNTLVLSKSMNYGFLESWLGRGLLTSTGSKWRHDRKMLTPAFHFEILKQYVEVFENVGSTFVDNLSKYNNAESFDVCPLTSLCTLDAISETAMGVKINAQKGENSNYVKCVSDMCHITIQRCLKIYYVYNCTYKLTSLYQREKRNLSTLHGFTQSVIREKEQNLKKSQKTNSNNKTQKLKFLDLMYSFLQDKGSIDYENLQNQVDTFMFAGHDTTSVAISFTLYCLSNHQEIQDKVYEEQKLLFGEEKNPEITYNDLQKMKYLELVIKESLRLYPPVPVIGRCADEDLHYDDHIIPKGTNIAVIIYEMHRNPKYFPEPEKFDPDRFINDIEPFAYLPFSAGFRNCIGQKFAMLELKSIISKVVRHFRIRPALPYHQVRVYTKNVLVSLNGVKIRVQKRE